MAIETGCLQGLVDQRRVTFAALASISTTRVSVRLAYTLPSPAAAPYSGLPPRGMLVIKAPEAASITVEEWASPFRLNTRFDAGSYRIASASSAAGNSSEGFVRIEIEHHHRLVVSRRREAVAGAFCNGSTVSAVDASHFTKQRAGVLIDDHYARVWRATNTR